MTKETRSYIEKECKELLKIDYACEEAKEVATKWLKVMGTPKEDEVAHELIKELKEDVESIEDLNHFAESKKCEEVFGLEQANKFRKHAHDLKKSGAKYCDCEACSAALNIINKEKDL
jgi:predicted peroxiredoxin